MANRGRCRRFALGPRGGSQYMCCGTMQPCTIACPGRTAAAEFSAAREGSFECVSQHQGMHGRLARRKTEKVGGQICVCLFMGGQAEVCSLFSDRKTSMPQFFLIKINFLLIFCFKTKKHIPFAVKKKDACRGCFWRTPEMVAFSYGYTLPWGTWNQSSYQHSHTTTRNLLTTFRTSRASSEQMLVIGAP